MRSSTRASHGANHLGMCALQSALAAQNPLLAYAGIGVTPLPPTEADFHNFLADMAPDFQVLALPSPCVATAFAAKTLPSLRPCHD